MAVKKNCPPSVTEGGLCLQRSETAGSMMNQYRPRKTVGQALLNECVGLAATAGNKNIAGLAATANFGLATATKNIISHK